MWGELGRMDGDGEAARHLSRVSAQIKASPEKVRMSTQATLFPIADPLSMGKGENTVREEIVRRSKNKDRVLARLEEGPATNVELVGDWRDASDGARVGIEAGRQANHGRARRWRALARDVVHGRKLGVLVHEASSNRYRPSRNGPAAAKSASLPASRKAGCSCSVLLHGKWSRCPCE